MSPIYWVLLIFPFFNILSKPLPPLKSATETKAVQKLKKEIEAILQTKKHKNLQAGILAISLDKNDILYELNSDNLLIPASVNKIFTAYSALKKLGPSFTFKTSIYHDGNLSEGTLVGNLYLVGGGDPSLVSERMWMLVNDFLRKGIKKIKGDVIGDDSFFDKDKTPPSRPTYLSDEAYNAPIGALSFNFNTTTVFVSASEKIGNSPNIYIDPENAYVEVVNQAKTGNENAKFTLNVSRLKEVQGDIGDTVLLRGVLPWGAGEQRYYRNIVNPTLYTCHMFKEFLKRRGIEIQGTTQEGKKPEGAKKVLEFESLPLWQVIWGMNKFSNNFVADQVTKTLGAETWGVPGSMQKGVTTVQDILEDIGIARKTYTIEDGSGLTRVSKVTPRQVVEVLRAANQDFSLSAEFMASLGRSGEDGTLRRRINSQDDKGQVRAKTGSLDGVNALAGYASTVEGENIAFAIILNDPRQQFGSMIGWVDQVARTLRRFHRKSDE